jgi:hypothetical protein
LILKELIEGYLYFPLTNRAPFDMSFPLSIFNYISHYAKTWHPWLEHIWLVSQFSHAITDVLQLIHFYEYHHFHDYMTLHHYSHMLKNYYVCHWPCLTNFWKRKNLDEGVFIFASWKLWFTFNKIMYWYYMLSFGCNGFNNIV